jgi:hypothetical protein
LSLIASSLVVASLVLLPTFSGVAFGSPNQANFTGTAFIHLIGKDASGNVVNQRLTDVSFSVTLNAGGPGVGTMTLNIPGMVIPGTVATGQIIVTNDRASGGGTLSNEMMGSQFAFAVNEKNGGQFHCLMAGFSGGFAFGGLVRVLQMDVHGTVPTGALVLS